MVWATIGPAPNYLEVDDDVDEVAVPEPVPLRRLRDFFGGVPVPPGAP